jgi:parallel beta-helix repeat protein
VWRHTSNSSGSASKISSPDPTGTSYDDPTAVAGTTYYYWVKARNAGGPSGFSASDSGYRQVDAVPGAPGSVILFSAVPANSQIALSWQNPPALDFDFVRIQRSTTFEPNAPDEGTNVYTGSGETFTDSPLDNGTTYSYAAFCYDFSGNASDGVPITAVPSPPPLVTIMNFGISDEWADWNYWPDERYEFQYEFFDSGNIWGNLRLVNDKPYTVIVRPRISIVSPSGTFSYTTPQWDWGWLAHTFDQEEVHPGYTFAFRVPFSTTDRLLGEGMMRFSLQEITDGQTNEWQTIALKRFRMLDSAPVVASLDASPVTAGVGDTITLTGRINNAANYHLLWSSVLPDITFLGPTEENRAGNYSGGSYLHINSFVVPESARGETLQIALECDNLEGSDSRSVFIDVDDLGSVIQVAPAQLNFGAVNLGTSSSLVFTVQNAGTGYLRGNATGTGVFTTIDGEYSLAAGQAKEVTVQFDPITEGISNGTVTFTGGGGTAKLVTGVGTPPPSGSVQLVQSSYVVDEGAGTVQIEVSRSGGSFGAASVNYATGNDTATAGSDYTGVSGTLNWGDGDSATKSFLVPITGDGTYEPDEDFVVTLSGASGASLGSPSQGTVTINDDDPPPPSGSVQLVQSSYVVGEGVGTLQIEVSRNGGSFGAASVNYATGNDTATAGSDYTAVSGTLNWGDGDSSTKSYMVPITGDGTYEPDEDFVVTLSGASGASLGSPSQATVTISNDDPVPSDTHYVSPLGMHIWPYTNLLDSATNIQAAIDTADDGDSVLVLSGVYQENVTLEKAISLIGENPLTTAIDASGFGKPIRIWNVSGAVTIAGLSLLNSGDGASDGIIDAGVIAHAGDLTIQHCIIASNWYGVVLTTPCTIRNSVIKGNRIAGIYVAAGADCEIESNTIVSNSLYGILGHSNGLRAALRNNVVAYHSTGLALTQLPQWSSAHNCLFNAIDEPSSMGTTDLVSQPIFEDRGAGDYRLGVGSPCIDAGTNLSWMANSTDFAGHARVRNGHVDIGAYELPYLDVRIRGSLSHEGLEITWPSLSNEYYTIEQATKVSDGFAPLFLNLSSTPPENRQNVLRATSPDSEFFRLSLTEPQPIGDLVYIPGGFFEMGAPEGEGFDHDRPIHDVYVSAFYIGAHEITVELYETVRSWAVTNGYDIAESGLAKPGDHPIVFIDWYDAVKWCNARSEMEDLSVCYYSDATKTVVYKTGQLDLSTDAVDWTANGYRLPTEAEWEKAGRGSVMGYRFPWYSTNTISHSFANYFSTGIPSYDVSTNSGSHPDYQIPPWPPTSPVGEFMPNAYALYDMAGNAQEWVWDWFDVGFYTNSVTVTATNPVGPVSNGWGRTIRGGGCLNQNLDASSLCRVAARYNYGPDTKWDMGFRVVRKAQ